MTRDAAYLPVVVALAMTALLIAVGLSGGARGRGAAPEDHGLVPQLPVTDPASTASGSTTVPGGTASAAASRASAPAPTVTVTVPVTLPPPSQPSGRPTPTVTDTVTVTAPAADGSPSALQDPETPALAQRLQVTGLVLMSDLPADGLVDCGGTAEITVTATVFVTGGTGDVIYQWVFDDGRIWTPDVLHFTGAGPRQQSLQIPWPVPAWASGLPITGGVRLVVLQPVLSAQSQHLSFAAVCA